MARKARTLAEVKKRLKYLRKEILAERISYGELAELQGLAHYIDPDDTLLLEWAGVPEWKHISKNFKTLAAAERYLNKLYNQYEGVQLVSAPQFSEGGKYVFRVHE